MACGCYYDLVVGIREWRQVAYVAVLKEEEVVVARQYGWFLAK
jgi:hypothetical protein